MAGVPAARTAPDGSLRPTRGSPTFERDVQRMFASIAARYDRFNHLATFGLDLLWRPRAVWAADRFANGGVHRILDVGCGTGALSSLLLEHHPGAEVVGVDFTGAMVRLAHDRSATRSPRPAWAVAGTPRLPFVDGTFDLVASAFVARNFADLPRAWAELRRVLRLGGTLLTLEVSEPASPAVSALFHAHFDRAVPILGRAFDREGPYRYLPESLKAFPPREALLGSLTAAGFGRSQVVPMSMGIVSAYLSEATGPTPTRPQP